MNNESFYGNPGSSSSKYTRRFVTLSEAQEETENRTVQNVVVFPPSSGDKNIDSDIEEKDDIVYLYLMMMRRSNPTLFLNALNTSVEAVWRIHTKYTDNNLSHLDFRSEVSLGLLKSVPSRTSFKRPRMSSFPDDVCFDCFEHYKAKSTQGRCIVCKKIPIVSMCQMLGAPSF